MPVTITRAQRDAIYEIVIPHLTAIGDVWLCVKRREFAEAKKMGREFAEELRLLEDLGWSETIDQDTVTLTVPPDELTRTVARLHRRAARSLGVYVSRPKNDEELAERDLAASETLGAILGKLARQAGGEELGAPPPAAAAKLVGASEELVQGRTPPADATAVATQKQLDEQTEAVELWGALDGLITRAQRLYDAVANRALDNEERARLEQIRPDALRAAYLEDAQDLQDLESGRVVARVREHIRILTALEAANPQELEAASGRRRFQEGAPLDTATLQAALLAADGVPEPRRSAQDAQRSAEDLLASIIRRDRLDFWISALIATLAFFPTVYSKDTFGSLPDYLAAFAAGAAGQLIVNWRLLPWFRSYRPAATGAKAAEAA